MVRDENYVKQSVAENDMVLVDATRQLSCRLNLVRCNEMGSFVKLTAFLDELNSRKIHFNLEYNRSGYVMVCIAVPGERWEVEFDSTGNVEVEVFKSGGPDSGLEGEEAIERLFSEFGTPDAG